MLTNNRAASKHGQIVYWHRELPPADAEVVAEHTVEATSGRVVGTLGHRYDLWDRCYRELMSNVRTRLAQEIERLGGDYAMSFAARTNGLITPSVAIVPS
jgi:hypothetical protein